jgi:hypothetical protein
MPGINIYFLSTKRDSHFNTAKIVFSLLHGNAKGQNVAASRKAHHQKG